MNKGIKTLVIVATIMATIFCMGNVKALTFERNGETIEISDPVDMTGKNYVLGYKTNTNSYMLFIPNETTYTITGNVTTNATGIATTEPYVSGAPQPAKLYIYSIDNGTWANPTDTGSAGGNAYMSEIIQTNVNIYNLANMSETLYTAGYGMIDSNSFDLDSMFTDSATILTGTTTMATGFISTLWANPVGKITICIGAITLAIGLAYALTRIRKGIGKWYVTQGMWK